MLGSIFRTLPTFKGKQRLAKLLMKNSINRDKDVYVHGKYDCKYVLPNIKENISFEIFINGIYEASTIEFIINRIPPNGIMLDIGANIGAIAFPVLKARKDVSAICIEASARVFKYLTINQQKNKIFNCSLINKAITDINGTIVSFFSPDELFGKGSLSPVFTKKEEKIETLTLDSLLVSSKVNKVDFIKIDVEGYEYMVFKGGEKLLSSSMAPDIVLEFVDWAESSAKNLKPGDAQKLLWKYGYSLYNVDELNRLNIIHAPITKGYAMIFASKK